MKRNHGWTRAGLRQHLEKDEATLQRIVAKVPERTFDQAQIDGINFVLQMFKRRETLQFIYQEVDQKVRQLRNKIKSNRRARRIGAGYPEGEIATLTSVHGILRAMTGASL